MTEKYSFAPEIRENTPNTTFGSHLALFCSSIIWGAAIPPSLPPAEQKPNPVARMHVGYNSHVKLKTTANEPEMAILPAKAYKGFYMLVGQVTNRIGFKPILTTFQFLASQILLKA